MTKLQFVFPLSIEASFENYLQLLGFVILQKWADQRVLKCAFIGLIKILRCHQYQ